MTRIVPLIAALGLLLLSSLALGEDVSVAAGKSWPAIKLQNAGVEYLHNGDFANARKNLDEAIRLDPTLWPAYLNRAAVNMREDRLKEALQDATTASRARTSFTRSAILRAQINSKLGNYDTALRELEQVVSLGSGGDAYPKALDGLAWFHATCPEARYRNGRAAITEAKSACSLTNYQSPGCLDTLAAAYAEVGDFDSALRFEARALSIRDSPLGMKDFQKHLVAFKRRRPWRE
jgi:tetratricopeptide (TPR) repeat protein